MSGLSEYYEDVTKRAAGGITELIQPAIILFVAGLVGFVAVAIISGIYSALGFGSMTDGPQTGAATADEVISQEFGWRNTPRINFAPERRLIPFSPVFAILVAVLAIEALVALTFFGRLQDARAEALAVNGTLENVQRALQQERAATDDVTDRVADIDGEIAQVEQQSAGAIEIYNRLTQRRPEWAAALQALLRANSPEFRIFSLAASPPAVVGSPRTDQPDRDRLRVPHGRHLSRLHGGPGGLS